MGAQDDADDVAGRDHEDVDVGDDAEALLLDENLDAVERQSCITLDLVLENLETDWCKQSIFGARCSVFTEIKTSSSSGMCLM